ncbi:PA14 domain-containing protein [Pyxidicoccus xibeiensis]|uniref:PA14 domain-containing protein n=1 Tax=Pyxidicoccus xibeiensis TaxID=2906759 RepID=UPI0020A7AC85|nr:PA14 domain-containing protein [Pyxidicoccus xibeiensis]MCP3143030.1 PA14 domain-containing protein [Pyxidicoccus xibeiensis]
MGLALWATACGTESENTLEPELAQADGELNTGSSCGPPQVAAVLENGTMPAREDRKCEGPWEYSKYASCYVKKGSLACGIERYEQTKCSVDKTCRHPDFGVESRATLTRTVQVMGERKNGRRCVIIDDRGTQQCETYVYYDFRDTCRFAATSAKAAVDDRHETGVTIQSHTPTPATAEGEDTETASCRYVLGGYPTYYQQQGSVCGSDLVDCDDTTKPIYKVCRDSSHGQAGNPEECHDEGLPGTLAPGRFFSGPGLTLNQLRASASALAVTKEVSGSAPRCTTDDDKPITTPLEVEQKFDRLQDQLQTLNGWESTPSTAPTGVDRALLRQLLVRKSKVLFELKGKHLTSAQVTKVVGLYRAYPEGGTRLLSRVDPTVNFDWGMGAPAPGVPADNFTVRWTGKVIPRYSQTYTFYTASDAGVRLWVDGKLLIDNWSPHGLTENLGAMTAALVAGQEYDIRLEFFEGTDSAVARLLWSSTSQTKEAIPSTQLRTPGGVPGLLGEYFDAQRADCRNPWVAPVEDSACAGASSVNGLFAMCRRLTLDHVPASSVERVMDTCINAIAEAEALACMQGKYGETYEELLPSLIKEQLATPHAVTAAARTEALRRKLGYVDSWYRKVRGPIYGGDRLSRPLNQRVSELLGEFWRGTYISERALNIKPGSGEPEAPPLSVGDIPGLSDTYLLADREVLKAAFPESTELTAPLTSAPLVLVVSDALQGLVERLGNTSDAHDLGCRFRQCASGKLTTEVSHQWKYLGILYDAAALNTTATAPIQKVDADWLAVYQQLNLRHDVLASALKDAAGLDIYSVLNLERTPQEQIAPVAYSLLETMKGARARTSSYEQFGTFDATLRNTLHAGMNIQEKDEIVNDVNIALNNLQVVIDAYNRDLPTYLQTYLEEMRGQRQAARTASEIQLMMKRVAQLDTDLQGMRHNARIAEARHADHFVRTFRELLGKPQVADFLVAQGPERTIPVSAEHANYSGSQPTHNDNIVVMSATGLVNTASAGDILHINVTGQWAPVCALSAPAAAMKIPGSPDVSTISTAGVTTGPEGFTVTFTGTGYTAQSLTHVNQDGTYDSDSITGDACIGVRSEAGTPFADLIGTDVEVFAEAKACIGYSHSNQRADIDTTTTANGSESRSSASFTAGLRVPGTPFPHLPVGSLLLVEMTKGRTERKDIQQVYVLHRPATTVLIPSRAAAPAGVDLYLVVNDRDGCDVSSDALTLKVNRATPVGSGPMAIRLLNALASAKAAVDEAGRNALTEGRVSASALATIRSNAYVALEHGCDTCGFNQFPSQLQGLFNAWIDHELAALSRRAEMIATEREMQLLAMELEALGADLARQEGESRLARQLPLLALRDLEGTELADATRQLTKVVNRDLMPIIELRYPEMLTTLAADTTARNELLALTDGVVPNAPVSQQRATHWTRSRVETAKVLRSFINRVMLDLSTRRSPGNDATAYPYIAVSFPRPGRPAGWQSAYKTVDAVRAEQVWKQILRREWSSFTVLPEDLYARDGYQGRGCSQGLMVIRAMGIHFGIPGSDEAALALNDTVYYPSLRVARWLTFATKTGPLVYEQLNDEYLGTDMRVTFGPAPKAEHWFGEKGVRALRYGNGLSPFTTFDFNLSALNDMVLQGLVLRDDVEEIVLSFEVETKPLSSDMTWIKSCVPPPTPTPTPTPGPDVLPPHGGGTTPDA